MELYLYIFFFISVERIMYLEWIKAIMMTFKFEIFALNFMLNRKYSKSSRYEPLDCKPSQFKRNFYARFLKFEPKRAIHFQFKPNVSKDSLGSTRLVNNLMYLIKNYSQK